MGDGEGVVLEGLGGQGGQGFVDGLEDFVEGCEQVCVLGEQAGQAVLETGALFCFYAGVVEDLEQFYLAAGGGDFPHADHSLE